METRFSDHEEVSEEVFYDMLGAVPPERMSGGAFLVGEAWDHNSSGEFRYEMFYQEGEKYFFGGLHTTSWFDRKYFPMRSPV